MGNPGLVSSVFLLCNEPFLTFLCLVDFEISISDDPSRLARGDRSNANDSLTSQRLPVHSLTRVVLPALLVGRN